MIHIYFTGKLSLHNTHDTLFIISQNCFKLKKPFLIVDRRKSPPKYYWYAIYFHLVNRSESYQENQACVMKFDIELSFSELHHFLHLMNFNY